jgi:hypothetical protein
MSVSPSKSAAAIELGVAPTASGLVAAAAKLPVPALRRIVTRPTLTSATARSRSPS